MRVNNDFCPMFIMFLAMWIPLCEKRNYFADFLLGGGGGAYLPTAKFSQIIGFFLNHPIENSKVAATMSLDTVNCMKC